MSEKGAVGQAIDRLDGRAKVTGQARYAAEAPMQNAVFAVIVSSTVTKGRATRIDTSKAISAAGVLAVVTSENRPEIKQGQGMVAEKRTALADNLVHYAGQTMAVVVADTFERARYAARLVDITYEEQKPIVDMHDPRAKEVHPTQSNGEQAQLTRGDVDAALAAPGVKVTKATYRTPVETHNPMEPSATTALWEAPDRLTAWNSTQAVSGNKTWLATSFGLKPEGVRVLCPFTGGGFGSKGGQWPHIALGAAVSKTVGRPVRQVMARQQMFFSNGHRPTTEQTITLGAGSDGKITALRHEVVCHGCELSDFVEPCAVGTSYLLYTNGGNYAHSHVVRQVDVAPPTFMRAPGESPGMFALESAMDELAHELGIDPVELRLRNHADVHPNTAKPWSSKHLKECYRIGAERFGWSRRNPAPRNMRAPDGRLMGWGMATATYPARKFPGSARIRLSIEGGRLRAVGAAASQDIGTGTWTIGAQMTASAVGLPISQVRFELGDSDLPTSGVSGGSTTAASIGQALTEAGHSLREALLQIAQLDAGSPLAGLIGENVELRGDLLVAKEAPGKSVSVLDLVRKSGKPYVEGAVHPPQAGQPASSSDPNARKYAFNSFGAHFIEILVGDPIPEIRVERVVSVMNVGKVVNPKTARSQVLGGVVMGLGMGLLEETVYDPRTGRPMNNNLADYHVCVNPDVKSIEVEFVDVPDDVFTPFGNRGVGEIGITGVAAAVANAVFHATGKRVRDLPVTLEKLL